MLYNLVLVDDEDWILTGIKNAIEWEEIGFQVVGTYSNGKDALEAMLENPPDAILTDIKMPIQDGISLVRELRKAGLGGLEVVFLSGYDDFELAQSSLRLGAVDYVLKPSDPEQIVDVFSKIKARLDERKKQEEERQKTERLAQTGIRVVKEAIYNSIVSSNEQLYERLMLLYAEFTEQKEDGWFHIVSAALNSTVKDISPDPKEAEAIENLKCCAWELRGEEAECLYLIKNPFSFSFVVSDYSDEKIDELIGRLQRMVRKSTGRTLHIVKGEKFFDFGRIRKAYEESLDKLFHLDMPEEVQQLYLKMGSDTVLKAAVEDRDQQVVLWSLKNWFLKIDAAEKAFQWRLIRHLVYGFEVFLLQSGTAFTMLEHLCEVLDQEDYEAAKKSIVSFVKSEFLPEKESVSRNAHLCREVARYISKNYSDEITLNDLANRFYISPNYLGTLFKKNMGIGIREYQTTIRLEQADILISSGKFRLYQVAEMVGYPNYEYFRKTYCKFRGRNPSE